MAPPPPHVGVHSALLQLPHDIALGNAGLGLEQSVHLLFLLLAQDGKDEHELVCVAKPLRELQNKVDLSRRKKEGGISMPIWVGTKKGQR